MKRSLCLQKKWNEELGAKSEALQRCLFLANYVEAAGTSKDCNLGLSRITIGFEYFLIKF